MPPKKGDLKVRKGSRLFGPMTLEDLLRLLENGRVAGDDEVSACDGPWTQVALFLQKRSAGAAEAMQTDARAIEAAIQSSAAAAGTLQVIHGNRKFHRLKQEQVARLLAEGRFQSADLVSVANGPWMPLERFLGQAAAQSPAVSATADDVELIEEKVDVVDELEVFDESLDELEVLGDIHPQGGAMPPPTAGAYPPHLSGRQAAYFPPFGGAPMPVSPVGPFGAPPASSGMLPARRLSDQWFVRIRGAVSANLTKENLHALMVIGEIKPGSMARHASWNNEQWMAITAIPELADLAKVAKAEPDVDAESL